MALITLMSANGSPGVTTTALGLALSWPRPVILIDADPTGARAILAGYFGGNLQPEHTIVDLAVAYRQGNLAESLSSMVTPIPNSQAQFLCGPLNHSQARALDTMWEPLAGVLKGLYRTGQDVIVDAGRLGLEGFATKLVTQADIALLVTRSTLPALVAASSWAQTMRSTFEHAGGLDSLSALVVGEGRPYNNAEVAKVLGLPVSASVAWDPTTAEVYSVGAKPGGKFQASALNKSLRSAIGSMSTQLARAQTRLQPTGGTA
jgi:Flp pilus assembly CpaE family ATPase